MKLTFSAVDNPEIAILLQVFANPKVDVNEVIGRTQLDLDGKGSPVAILKAISTLPSLKEGSTESLLDEQWLNFAYDVVKPELQVTHDLEGKVWKPLHAALEGRVYFNGTFKPSLADWTLFALLANHIAAMVPSMGQKYFRLIRWADHMGYLGRTIATKGALAELQLPNIQSIEDAMAGLDLKSNGKSASAASVKPAKEKEKKAAAPKAAPAVAEIASHPFARVDLRVGKIIKAERHPAADRLFIETVDLGEAEPRTVVSGLVGHVELEALQDRLAIFICNLKPATLCKTVSSAMLLVSKDADGLEPLIVPTGAKAGDRVSIDGVTPQPDAVIKPKEDTWEKVRVDLKVVNGVAHWQDKPLLVSGAQITSTKAPNGEIS